MRGKVLRRSQPDHARSAGVQPRRTAFERDNAFLDHLGPAQHVPAFISQEVPCLVMREESRPEALFECCDASADR